MYAAIRQGKAKTGMAEELTRRIKEGAIPIISDVPGFMAYDVVYAPDDTMSRTWSGKFFCPIFFGCNSIASLARLCRLGGGSNLKSPSSRWITSAATIVLGCSWGALQLIDRTTATQRHSN